MQRGDVKFDLRLAFSLHTSQYEETCGHAKQKTWPLEITPRRTSLPVKHKRVSEVQCAPPDRAGPQTDKNKRGHRTATRRQS